MGRDRRTVADPQPAGTDRDAGARRRAAVLAGHDGDPVAARTLLTDPTPVVRASALGALARTGDLLADEVRAALADGDPTVRRRALACAVPFAEVLIAPLLDDPDDTVVEQAAWACGEREPPEAGIVAPLAAVATGHDDALCREAAVAALGAVGDPEGLPAILAATGDKATVRRRAVIALAPFEGPEVDAALRHALDDRDWQVRQAAEDQLDGGGP
jgi:HEAT repeat protein